MKPPRRLLLLLTTAIHTAACALSSDAAPGGLPARHWSGFQPIPNVHGVAAPFAGVSDGVLLVAGGANFPGKRPWEGGEKVWHDAIFALPRREGAWLQAGTLPRPLAYGLGVTTRRGLVCVGGSDARQHHTNVFLLRWNSGSVRLQELPPLPHPCANMTGAAVGSRVYVAGGTQDPTATEALRTFWMLDLDRRHPRWETLEPWPGPGRMLAVAGVHAGRFYLFSGVSLSPGPDQKPRRTYLRDAYSHRQGTGWTRLPDMPRAAAAAPSPAPATGNRLFIFTGDDGTRAGYQPMEQHPGFPKDTLAFNATTGEWEPGPTAPFSRATVPVVPWHGRFVIPSGESRPGVRSPEVWAWTPIAP